MKNIFCALALLIGVLWASPISMAANPNIITDIYKFKMSVKTPRIYDNMQSKGYRKYKIDHIEGELWLSYTADGMSAATIQVTNLVNKTYKVGGKNVTYTAYLDDYRVFPRVNLIGNNKTGVFKTPSVVFSIVCDPSYNVGEVDEDNTLYIDLAGNGTTSTDKKRQGQVIKSLRGYLAGTLGCGCSAYGHVSPTRINGAYGPIAGYVDDVAAVWGSWKATYKSTIWGK